MRTITIIFCSLLGIFTLCVACKQPFHYHYINNQVLYPETEGGDTLIVFNASDLNNELEKMRKINHSEQQWDDIFRRNCVVDNTPRKYYYQTDGADTIWKYK